MAPTTTPVPLPDMEGPKLEPFRGTASADIKLESFIGSSKDLDSQVWRVAIDGRTYVLKIVSTTRLFSTARPASRAGEIIQHKAR